MDSRTTFARWRVNGPYKPITRKGLGQRMGGGKGAIDHYVTPVRYGRLIVEVGGKVELAEVEHILTEVARKLPFPAKVRWQIQFSMYFASCVLSRVSINVTWILRSKSDDYIMALQNGKIADLESSDEASWQNVCRSVQWIVYLNKCTESTVVHICYTLTFSSVYHRITVSASTQLQKFVCTKCLKVWLISHCTIFVAVHKNKKYS